MFVFKTIIKKKCGIKINLNFALYFRAKKKEKLKKKKLEQKLLDIKQLGPTRKELKMKKMALSKCNVSVVLDFSFDQLMSHKDVCKCIKQLGFCYSINRRTENPLQFHVTGFSGVSRDEMQRHLGYTNWDVNFHDESYLNIFKKEDLIYLTSDSENVITTLEERKTYIIGGLVDHNSYKGHCLKIAEEQSISHGRLPIKEHLEMKTREVLSIVHGEIMLYISFIKTVNL
ncbi:hypothetical protein AAG570_009754 [Ranatra chinensis]|uniref:tRNA (guanine(9)-N(1))-methyltransferase n=1 Tax=Ranatra chinensis TaxID=642074 RepID=A0ABD0ZD99_9HEMI